MQCAITANITSLVYFHPGIENGVLHYLCVITYIGMGIKLYVVTNGNTRADIGKRSDINIFTYFCSRINVTGLFNSLFFLRHFCIKLKERSKGIISVVNFDYSGTDRAVNLKFFIYEYYRGLSSV